VIRYSFIFCFIGFCLTVTSLLSQSVAGVYLTIADGLASNTIYDIKQDDKGYIWIGHTKGISRYDGKKFKHYYNNIQSSRSLTSIHFDYKGRVWCQNFAGEVLCLENDELRIETRIEKMNSYAPIHLLEKRYLYYTTEKELKVFDIEKGINKTLFYNTHTADFTTCTDSLYCYFITNSGAIYRASVHSEVQIIDSSKKDYGNHHFFKMGDILYSFHKTNKRYYVIYQNHIYKHDLDNHSSFIHGIRYNEQKRLVYMLGSDGVEVLDIKTGKISLLIEDVATSAFCEDKHHNIWIGTQNKGIVFVSNPSIKKVSHIENIVSGCVLNDTTVCAGDNNGIIHFINTNTMQKVKEFNTNIKHELTCMKYIQSRNQMFLGSFELNITNFSSIKYISEAAIKDIDTIPNGIIALAVSGGIGFYPYEKAKLYYDVRPTNIKIGFANIPKLGRFRDVLYHNNVLYGCGNIGLYAITPTKIEEIRYQNTSLISFAICGLNNDTILISSNRYGLCIYSKGYVTLWDNPYQQDFLENPIIRMESSKYFVWLLNDRYLYQIDKKTKKITRIDYVFGLPAYEYKNLFIHNNTLFLCTNNGLEFFPENTLFLNKGTPNIYITKIHTEKNTYIADSRPLVFSSKENNITIDFDIPYYNQLVNKHLLFTTDGIRWDTLDKKLSDISLRSLSSGSYFFQIKLVDNKGVVLASSDKVYFKISPPWYKNIWFILTLIIFTVGVIILFFRTREEQIKQKEALQSEKLKLETELQKTLLSSIKSQMNPHFLFNALNTIQSYIFMNEKEKASFYLVKFSKLTRMILDFSTKETIPLSEEIKILELYCELEKMRFENTIDISFYVDEKLNTDAIFIPPMLIQPYVENVFKHGLLHKKNDRKLSIQFLYEPDMLKVVIDDNGVGRKFIQSLHEKKNKSASFSSNATAKRIEIMRKLANSNYEVQVTDKYNDLQESAGTTVVISIPIHYSQKI
jgi:sensor histidine kinase YesM